MLCKKTFIKVRRYLFLAPELRDSLWSRKSSKLFLEISKLKLQKYFTFYHRVNFTKFHSNLHAKFFKKGPVKFIIGFEVEIFLDGILTNKYIFFHLYLLCLAQNPNSIWLLLLVVRPFLNFHTIWAEDCH